MKHLSYEDMERYLDEEDLSEEYLHWLEPVMEHLDSCQYCREKINRLMLITEVCDGESMGNALMLLWDEDKIRRETVAYQLEKMIQDARMKEVIQRLKEGGVFSILAKKVDFLKSQSVMRGETEVSGNTAVKYGKTRNDGGIILRYDASKIYVMVPADPKKNVTVILALQEEQGVKSLISEAVWSVAEGVAIAEFEVQELGENYEIYVDIR